MKKTEIDNEEARKPGEETRKEKDSFIYFFFFPSSPRREQFLERLFQLVHAEQEQAEARGETPEIELCSH